MDTKVEVSHLLISCGETIELSKSNFSFPRRSGAGEEVRGRPVRRWNTMEAAESKDFLNVSCSTVVGTPGPECSLPCNEKITHELPVGLWKDVVVMVQHCQLTA